MDMLTAKNELNILSGNLNVNFIVNDLFSKATDRRLKKELREKLENIIKNGFPIDIYEVQIEIHPAKDKKDQRMLHTEYTNYSDPRTVPIWDNKKRYTGQTTYAFIKNKPMWITDKNEKCLDKKGENPNAEYRDEWSNTELKDTIPDFWVLEESKHIRTSVILPLRFPGLYSNFGFIDFESNKCVHINDELTELFKSFAEKFAHYYINSKLSEK